MTHGLVSPAVIDDNDVLPLEALEPFGWIFTPGRLPPDFITSQAASQAVVDMGTVASLESGRYTEKGRYRESAAGRRTTLYLDHPVWVATTVPPGASGPDDTPAVERAARHTLLDARTGDRLTQFVVWSGPTGSGTLDLHEALAAPAMTAADAVSAATQDEERILAGSSHTAEYGAHWRLLPGFVQVIDVWRITFDTSALPPIAPDAPTEVAWVVLVDDKAGHRWVSAALEETPTANDQKV